MKSSIGRSPRYHRIIAIFLRSYGCLDEPTIVQEFNVWKVHSKFGFLREDEFDFDITACRSYLVERILEALPNGRKVYPHLFLGVALEQVYDCYPQLVSVSDFGARQELADARLCNRMPVLHGDCPLNHRKDRNSLHSPAFEGRAVIL